MEFTRLGNGFKCVRNSGTQRNHPQVEPYVGRENVLHSPRGWLEMAHAKKMPTRRRISVESFTNPSWVIYGQV